MDPTENTFFFFFNLKEGIPVNALKHANSLKCTFAVLSVGRKTPTNGSPYSADFLTF